ncbi:MAG: CBS domain-containing protein, partial [Candidatus Rokubacteria bacterium]|nr:CBS domain-containing protein [Candidatus Rokubacteria bacterium]
MLTREWMTPAPVTVAPSTSLAQAQELMFNRRIRHLPVVEHDRLVGIITDRDVRTVRPSPATSLEQHEIRYLLDRLKVGEVMSRNVITVGPDESLAVAVRLMIESRIGGLPVVEQKRVVGILTEIDLLRALASTLGAPAGRPPRPADAPIDIPGSRLILVALDGAPGSETVLAAIGVIARAEGATVRLLHVAPPVETVRDDDDRIVAYADQETRRIEAETHDYFRRVATSLGEVPVEFAVRFGEPAAEIVSEAEDARANLIAMASHRRKGLARFVRGSVAER